MGELSDLKTDTMEEKDMYKNSGKKLLRLIKIITAIMMGACVIAGIAVAGNVSTIMGILIAVVGCFIAWLSNLVLATFAEMAMDVHRLADKWGSTDAGLLTMEGGVSKEQPPQETWTCAACGQINLKRVASCQACGVAQSWSEAQANKVISEQKIADCPQCGAAVQQKDAFCGHCGAKIGE